jgi:hypothetical protein
MDPGEQQFGQPSVTPDRADRSPDILEVGPSARGPQRRLVWLTTVALAFGGVTGFLVGRQHPAGPVSGVGVGSRTTPVADPPLTATGRRCAIQRGVQLQLGIEVANPADSEATLVESEAVLPLVGLQATTRTWGSCGELPAPFADRPAVLAAHGSGWMTVTFDVQVPCPAAIPVKFAVTYQRHGEQTRTQVSGFADLGEVAYSGCPAPS